jgi:hypothetical protein
MHNKLEAGTYFAVSGTTINTAKAFLVTGLELTASNDLIIRVDGNYTVNASTGEIVGTFSDEDVSNAKTTTIVWKSRFLHDVSPKNSSTDSNYVSRPMSLQIPSTGLRVTMDISLPTETELEVYYRSTMQNGFTFLSENQWIKMDAIVPVNNTPLNNFIETMWEVNNIPSYDQIQVKVALKSTNPAKTPKFKNVRQLALS